MFPHFTGHAFSVNCVLSAKKKKIKLKNKKIINWAVEE